MRYFVVLLVLASITFTDQANAEYPLGFSPIVNEISFYQNSTDDGDNMGQTLQFVLINSINIGTALNIEFTADINRDMVPGEDYDYYIEFGLVKPVWKKFSVNYQRIHSTFVDKPVNQFGFRYSF